MGDPQSCQEKAAHRKSEKHNPVRNALRKSDETIVVKKQANKATKPAAESVERRVSAKGNSSTNPEVKTQSLIKSERRLERIRVAAPRPASMFDPTQEPDALEAHARICAGGLCGQKCTVKQSLR